LLACDGSSLIRRAVSIAIESGIGPVYVTLGSQAERMHRELEGLAAKVVENPLWQEGIASSIRAGLQRACIDSPDTDGLLVMVCDQPATEALTLRNLKDLQEQADTPLAVCSYGGALGTPAIFHRSLFDELMALEGDTGAKRVIQRHMETAVPLDFPEGARDIDTEEDYVAWTAGTKHKEKA
jgi:molybdenum cofactor cytidylyltransferase